MPGKKPKATSSGNSSTTKGVVAKPIKNFALYHTFNVNIPTKDLTIKQKDIIEKKIPDLSEEEVVMMTMLITEDARLFNNYKPLFSGVELPYDGIEMTDEEGKKIIRFDLESFPIRLRWVLLKFIGMVCGKSFI